MCFQQSAIIYYRVECQSSVGFAGWIPLPPERTRHNEPKLNDAHLKAEWQGLNLLAKIGGAKNKARERRRQSKAWSWRGKGARVCFETALTAANKTVRRKARLRRWAQRSKRRSHKPASQLHSHGHDGGGMKRDSSLCAGYQRKTISVPCAYACLCTCVRGELKL